MALEKSLIEVGCGVEVVTCIGPGTVFLECSVIPCVKEVVDIGWRSLGDVYPVRSARGEDDPLIHGRKTSQALCLPVIFALY